MLSERQEVRGSAAFSRNFSLVWPYFLLSTFAHYSEYNEICNMNMRFDVNALCLSLQQFQSGHSGLVFNLRKSRQDRIFCVAVYGLIY